MRRFILCMLLVLAAGCKTTYITINTEGNVSVTNTQSGSDVDIDPKLK